MQTTNIGWPFCVPGSPHSSPWWRWELAEWCLATGEEPPKGFEDEWFLKARTFLASPKSAPDGDVVLEAHRLFRERTLAGRDLLEAYLLTGEPLAFVASRCCLSVPTVEAYTHLFCAMPPRKSSDWVTLHLVGPALVLGVRKSEIGRVWKGVGYHAGSLALDAIVAVSVEDGLLTPPPPGFPEVASFLNQKLRQSIRLFLGSHLLPWDTPAERLAELHAQVRRIEALSRLDPERGSMADALEAAVYGEPTMPRKPKKKRARRSAV